MVPGPIVCGVDRSPAARAAARLAAAFADRFRLPLVFAHAVGRRRADRGAGRALLARVRRELDAPDASLHVGAGPAAAVLADAGRAATLLAVGGPAVPSRPLGGRVRASLARRSPCPLVVVPPVPPLGGREVLCGVLDWADVAAAEHAARLAATLDLELTLMHVLPAPASAGWTESAPGAGVPNRPWDEDAAHRLLAAVATAVGAAPAARVAYGPAGPTLAREAEARDAALLVIGPPSQGLVGSMLTGSASAHLVRRTRRPLLVCSALRPEEAPLWPPLSIAAAS